MKPTILCLRAQQFSRDIHELKKHGQRYEYMLGPELSDAQPWLPPPLREQAAYVNHSGPEVDIAWDKSRRYGLEVIAEARQAGADVVAVLAGHWDYWNEECMRMACADAGLPFLVLLRESYLNTYEFKRCADHFAKWERIPQPHAIAMAGDMTVDLFTRLKLFPKAPLVATGWPRLDVWRRPTQPILDRPVVLASYFKGYAAEQHFLDMLSIFDDMAKQYPQVPFVVKAKHLYEAEQLIKIVRERGLSIQVTDLVELPTLLCNARAVIGFNSMLMLESLLSPAQLIIPYWGETEQDPNAIVPSPLDERFIDHVIYATSEKMLREMVAWAIAGKLPPPDLERRPRLYGEFFTYTQDRTNVERVEDFIETALRAPL